MEKVLDQLITFCVNAGGKIIAAALIYLIGRIVIKKILALIDRSKSLQKVDTTVRSFTGNFLKWLLYVILFICIITVLGVPMASVITVLASCGVAIGMAMQGSLSNFAGGIMLMLFRPFRVGDYIDAAGSSGSVKEINMFYTVLITPDACQVTIPNGTLMAANITNYSTEGNRRVELTFTCARGEDVAHVQDVLLREARMNNKVLKNPEPFASLSSADKDAMTFTVRVWTKNADYWDVYYDLTQKITTAMLKENIASPGYRIIESGNRN